MAATSVSPRPPSRTPARPVRSRSNTAIATEPPEKKRKFTPGGGRFLDPKDTEPLVPQTSPRTRPVRARAEKSDMTDIQTPSITRSAAPARARRARRPGTSTPRPRYTNAAAAAAASQMSDGYKPREERSWEDFHPDMDIDAPMLVFTADEVDGRVNKNPPKADLAQALAHLGAEKAGDADGESKDADGEAEDQTSAVLVTPAKRRPGRPPRRPESMLSGLGSPPAPRILPLPTHNPKERLNLPKPSFRLFNHFLQYEENQRENKVNYVDRTMAHVGYQESDRFELPPKTLIRLSESQNVDDEADVSLRLESDGPAEVVPAAPVVGRVEYDMDEQDVAWLEEINEQRKTEGVEAIKPAILEITMTQIEKEYHALEKRIPKPQPRHAQMTRPRSSSQAAVNGDPNPGDEPDSKCAICDDGDCENANAIIFCDGCDLAVHQECYGVPFIPEGQWFCRKCKEIGRGTPTCIFCPNVDGAFKQTSTLRWSHLLCAIWIPEVTIANMTFMEPITDVDKVPKSRWKLHCYICNQRMGACIQCGNKNCYLAFHVTCARRAKLFLKMKSQHQGGIDASALKAFCDKHVPPDWRRTHDTDNAIVEAKRWYRHAMKDRRWADNQSAALELGAPPHPDGGLVADPNSPDDTIAVTNMKRKREPQKMSWRLPSGAPVVPGVIYNTVEASLARFTIRKRKEFVEKAAKYWTLKREARRGAALLKRLQVQLETFSSMEVTRRNFAAMGAAGRPRLLRRIEFGELLSEDMAHLTKITAQAREREELRLHEAVLLRELVDTVYFPIPLLLVPILKRAQKLDEKTQFFTDGFDEIAARLRERYYTSVSDFSRDISHKISAVLAVSSSSIDSSGNVDINAIHTRLNEVKPGTAEHLTLTHEQKELKKLAKRIVKAVKEPIEEAMKKEADLKGHEHEEELRKLDSMGIFASSKAGGMDDLDEAKVSGKRRSDSDASAVGGASPEGNVAVGEADQENDEAVIHLNVAGKNDTVPYPHDNPTPASKTNSCGSSSHEHTGAVKPDAPPSPPISTDSNANPNNPGSTDTRDVFTHGGVPWYLEQFDPVGTTIHEERYTGRAVLRDMSEELSDMDEDTLTELAATGTENTPKGTPMKEASAAPSKKATKQTAASKRRKRLR